MGITAPEPISFKSAGAVYEMHCFRKEKSCAMPKAMMLDKNFNTFNR